MSDSRSRMLARIRDSLQTNRAFLEQQAQAFPPPHPRGPFVASTLDPVDQFAAEVTTLQATVHLCDDDAQATQRAIELLERAGARDVLSWAAAALPIADLLDRLADAGISVIDRQVLGADRAGRYAELEPVRACVSGVDAAIAESGTLLVLSGAGRGRLASLLPPMHIAVLRADQIVRTLPEAFDRLRERHGDGLWTDRSNVVLITGPSRTADIEQSLTLGVHGPRDVHVIVIR